MGAVGFEGCIEVDGGVFEGVYVTEIDSGVVTGINWEGLVGGGVVDGDVEEGVLGDGVVEVEFGPGLIGREGDWDGAEGGVGRVATAGEIVMGGDLGGGEGAVVDCDLI